MRLVPASNFKQSSRKSVPSNHARSVSNVSRLLRMRKQVEEMERLINSAPAPRPLGLARLAAEFQNNREIDSTIVKVNLSKPAFYSSLAVLIERVDEVILQCMDHPSFETLPKHGSYREYIIKCLRSKPLAARQVSKLLSFFELGSEPYKRFERTGHRP